MIERLGTYRNLFSLRDGVRVLLRALEKSDKDLLQAMFARVSNEDLRYMRANVKDPAVVQKMIDELDYSRVIPLVAVVNGNIVGDATLHRGQGPYRHTGELRIFLAEHYRQRGLGTTMLKSLIDIANKLDMHLLTAEIVAEKISVIRAFQGLGFQLQTTFPGYFMTPDGETLDVALLVLSLAKRSIIEF